MTNGTLLTRITANLYNTDGTISPIDVVHLHHAAWLSSPSYGNFAVFFANGEEKTRFELPSGYGMHVAGSDTWSLAYMLHNLTPNSQHVYVTYDLDYVPATGRRLGNGNGKRPIALSSSFGFGGHNCVLCLEGPSR